MSGSRIDADVRDAGGLPLAIHALDSRRGPCDDPELLPTLCGRELESNIVRRSPNPAAKGFCPDCLEVVNAALNDAEGSR